MVLGEHDLIAKEIVMELIPLFFESVCKDV